MKLNWECSTHDFHYLNLFQDELRFTVWRRNNKENYLIDLNDCFLTDTGFNTKEEAMKFVEEWFVNQINQIMESK